MAATIPSEYERKTFIRRKKVECKQCKNCRFWFILILMITFSTNNITTASHGIHDIGGKKRIVSFVDEETRNAWEFYFFSATKQWAVNVHGHAFNLIFVFFSFFLVNLVKLKKKPPYIHTRRERKKKKNEDKKQLAKMRNEKRTDEKFMRVERLRTPTNTHTHTHEVKKAHTPKEMRKRT